MPESVHFDADLYRREAIESAAAKYVRRARIDIEEAGANVIARVESVHAGSDARRLVDEFCTEVLSITVTHLRELGMHTGAQPDAASAAPPWGLLAPFAE